MAMTKSDSERLVAIETNFANLDKKVTSICGDVKNILVNHLPHIQQEIKVNKIKITLVVGVVSIVLSSVISVLVTKLIDRL